MAASMYYSTKWIDLLISFNSATWLRVAQVTGVGSLFVPITLVSYVGVPAEKSNTVSGMVNFMRNIGSSVGTSMVTIVIARRGQFHRVMLSGNTILGPPSFQIKVNDLVTRLTHYGVNPHDAEKKAYAMIHGLQSQTTTLAYIDTFWVLAVGSAIMFVLSFLLKKNNPGGGETVAV